MKANTAYSAIKICLLNNGYTEIPDLLNVDEVKEPQTERGFILQPVGSREMNDSTNCALLSEHNWKIDIVYKNIDSDDRVSKYMDFQDIKVAIKNLTGFKGFIGEPKFDRLNNLTNLSLGTLEFSLGLEKEGE